MNNQEMTIKALVYENELYEVRVVRVPDMFFDTYAIINKRTGVPEQIHPNQYNAMKISDQFERWLKNGADESDAEIEGDAIEMFRSLGSVN